MTRKEYQKLIEWYGEAKAQKAAEWFGQFSATFRNCVKQAQYCRDNEYLWG